MRSGEGLELFFNRDELLTRAGALAPRVRDLGATRFLAPTDGDAGGSWIAVSDIGLVLCLLNRCGGDDAVRVPPTSRGLLLLSLVDAAGAADALARANRLRLRQYRPFALLAWSPGEPVQALRWDGVRSTLRAEPALAPPLASSSVDEEGAERNRTAVWRRHSVAQPHGRDAALAFHRSHEPAPSPVSVCMHRPDAETVSFTTLRVAEDVVSLTYSPGPPCRGAAGRELRLRRRRA